MKKNSEPEDEVKTYDNATKAKYVLPKKISLPLDDIKTKKSKTDSFSDMCDRILSEK